MNILSAPRVSIEPDPSNWPAWTDQRWTLVDKTDHSEMYQPTPNDALEAIDPRLGYDDTTGDPSPDDDSFDGLEFDDPIDEPAVDFDAIPTPERCGVC